MSVHETIQLLQVQDLVWLAGVFSVAIATLIQKASKKYKPWTWLAQQFGKAMNKEMLDKLETIETKVDQLEKADQRQDAETAEEKAKAARRRILKFSDEIRRREKHSEEYFNDVLEDISFYKQYCLEHSTFQNEKAVLAISLIENAYTKCVEDDDFL